MTQLNSTVVTGWQHNDAISIVTSRCCAQTTRCLLAWLIPRLHDRANIEQTSSRPDGTPPPGSNVGLGLAFSLLGLADHVLYRLYNYNLPALLISMILPQIRQIVELARCLLDRINRVWAAELSRVVVVGVNYWPNTAGSNNSLLASYNLRFCRINK